MARVKVVQLDDRFLLTTGLSINNLDWLFNKLPPDATIIGFGRAQNTLKSYLFVKSAEFEDVKASQEYPVLNIDFEKE